MLARALARYTLQNPKPMLDSLSLCDPVLNRFSLQLNYFIRLSASQGVFYHKWESFAILQRANIEMIATYSRIPILPQSKIAAGVPNRPYHRQYYFISFVETRNLLALSISDGERKHCGRVANTLEPPDTSIESSIA